MSTVLLVFVASGFWFTAQNRPDFVVLLFLVLMLLLQINYGIRYAGSPMWRDEDVRVKLAIKVVFDAFNTAAILSALFVIFYVTFMN